MCVVPYESKAEAGVYKSDYDRKPIRDYSGTVVPYNVVHNRRSGQVFQQIVCDGCGCESSSQRNLNLCSVCRQATYCGKKCQKKHWKKHKAVCKELAALREPHAAEGWVPSTTECMCDLCGFGPVGLADMIRHAELTGHAPRAIHEDGSAGRMRLE